MSVWQEMRHIFIILIAPAFVFAACSSEKAVLDKLREEDWDVWPGAAYDIARMNDKKAVTVLLQALTDEDRDARWHAPLFLSRYDDPRILPALKKAFLDPDEAVCLKSAQVLADIDAEYAADFLVTQVAESDNPYNQETAAWLLSEMKDKRVIPFLVKRLDNPDTRRDAALELARFGDKRAVPALMEMLPESPEYKYTKYSTESVIDALIRAGDERCIPVLLGHKDYAPVFLERLFLCFWDGNFRDNAFDIPHDFEMSLVSPLIEIAKSKPSWDIRYTSGAILGNMTDPGLAPIFGKIFLETDSYDLRTAMEQGLKNMGTPGAEYLLMGARRENCYSEALRGLGSYNSSEIMRAVAELALDRSYPFRLQVIGYLQHFGALWKAEVTPFVLELLRDPDPIVRLHTMPMIKELKLRGTEAALQKALDDPHEHVRAAASDLLDSFSGKIPFKLEVEMDQSSYSYDDPVNLRFRITNAGNRKASICTWLMSVEHVLSGAVHILEIYGPDGERLEYRGPAGMPPAIFETDHLMLQPGDVLSGTIPISKYYWLDKPGRYKVKFSYRSAADGVGFGQWWWSGVLNSKDVSFKLKPPSSRKLKAMLARLDMEKVIAEGSWDQAHETCRKLGELESLSSIEPLKKLAFHKPVGAEEIRWRQEELSGAALNALAKMPSRKLIPMWVEILENKAEGSHKAMEALVRFRHPRAIEALRHQADSVEAALQLKAFGDDTPVKWIKRSALRDLKHWDPGRRQGAIRELIRLHESEGLFTALKDSDPGVRELATWWLREVAKDQKAVAGLEKMLNDPDPDFQKAIAYQLASLGSPAGVNLIEQDLDADDSETREKARYAILKLAASLNSSNSSTKT